MVWKNRPNPTVILRIISGRGLSLTKKGLALARLFRKLQSRNREDGCATGQPQGVGPEAYLKGTSQGAAPEDARKYGHIIRARCAPLSPASGFPVSRLQSAVGGIHETSGLNKLTS
jgi:hypothetical protein